MALLLTERNNMWPSNLRLLLEQEMLRRDQAQRNQALIPQRNPNPLQQLESVAGRTALTRDILAQMAQFTAPSAPNPTLSNSVASYISAHSPLMDPRIQLHQLLLMRQHQQQHEQEMLQRRFEDLQRVMRTVEPIDHSRPTVQRDFATLHNTNVAQGYELQVKNEPTTDSLSGSIETDTKPQASASAAEDSITNSDSTQKPKKKDARWMSMLSELKEYKVANGDCIVPRGYSLNSRLASWVAEQRKQYKLMKDGRQSSITFERIELLNELNFSWNAQEAAWDRHMSDLKQFKSKHGHCHVPLNYPDFPKLGLWVKEQRRHYTLLKQGKPSHMNTNRAEQLEKIGFCWDTHEATWLDRLRELTQFKEQNGNCIVPTNYSENPKLGTWVHHQRRQYKKFQEGKPCHITEDRIQALESIGFVWSARDKGGSSVSSADSDHSDSETEDSSLEERESKRQRLSSFE